MVCSKAKKGGLVFLVALVFSGLVLVPSSSAEKSVTLPKGMFWSCYDVGSSGYVQASAIAEALLRKYGTRVRLLPSGTSIGRLMPLTTKKVDCAWMGNDLFFASEGIYDFASIEWGPQDLRCLLAKPATVSFVSTKVSGVKTIEDLKGKRVTWIPGATSLNFKIAPFLAFGGLTWEDVKRVEFPNYGSALKGLIEGRTDAAIASPVAPLMYELESSARGIYHIPFPPEKKEAWKKMQKTLPFLSPARETIGAGIDPEKGAWILGYRYPMIAVYGYADSDWAYNLTKACHETFSLYKGARADMPRWNIEASGVPPADIPFHEGAVRYLKEIGVWKAEHDAWNNERIEHLKRVQEAWEKALDEAEAKKVRSKDFPEFWLKVRAEALGEQ